MTPILKIKKTSDTEWYTLPVPMSIAGSSQVLDGGNSGRDATTGRMFRDIVRDDVATYNCTLPDGITNVQMVEILNIILSDSFSMFIPDIRTGTFEVREFYVATAEPQIKEIYSVDPPEWDYEEFSFNAVQM